MKNNCSNPSILPEKGIREPTTKILYNESNFIFVGVFQRNYKQLLQRPEKDGWNRRLGPV